MIKLGTSEDKYKKPTQISLYGNYEEIFLDVVIVRKADISEERAIEIANDGIVTLYEDRIYVEHSVLGNFDVLNKELYQFEVCTKDTEPVDISKLTQEEVIKLINDERYFITEDDCKKVNWSIEEAYRLLRQMYPKKDYYKFDSLAYSIKRF